MADYQGIFGGGGGGSAIASVVGGTAISVDNTDPLNPVINCTFVAPVTSVNGLTGPVTLTAASVGAAATSHTHAASDLTSGTIATARLGTGTASATTFLAGDQSYKIPPYPVTSVAGKTDAVVLDAGDVTTGVFDVARLGTGTANSSVYLRGDGTWAAVSGGITGFTSQISTAAPNATTNVSQLLVAVSTTNGDIVLQAKGNGAVLAQIPDSTATGGNKRGTYAVDFQRDRILATQVASGSYATIINGFRNTASSNWAFIGSGTINTVSGSSSFIGGGDNNTASGNNTAIVGGNGNSTTQAYGFVGGGLTNGVTSQYGSILGGSSNSCSGTYSTVAGGSSNSVSNAWSSIGGGYQNTNAGQYCAIVGGASNVVDSGAQYSIIGGQGGRVRDKGVFVLSNYYNSSNGDTQLVDAVYNGRLTTATPTYIGLAGSQVGVQVPQNACVTFHFLVTARQSGSSNVAGWEITGVCENTGGTLTYYNVVTNLIHRTVGTWSVSVGTFAAGTVGIQVTGTANTISWTAVGRFAFTLIA